MQFSSINTYTYTYHLSYAANYTAHKTQEKQTPGSQIHLVQMRLQVWYDDPQSLRHKVAAASRKGLRGVGVWHLDCLDYSSDDPKVREQTRQMWAALRPAAGTGEVPLLVEDQTLTAAAGSADH